MNKYEKLIEYIINDNEQKARELFHEIVVEKSRDIYESLMDEEQVEENFGSADPAGEMIDDVTDHVDETGLGEDDEEGEEFSLGDEPGEDDEMGGEIGDDHEHSDIKADLEDIKDKIDQLLADVGGSDMDGDEEIGGDMDGEEDEGEEAFAEAPMMEEAEEESDDEEEDESKEDKKEVKESKSVAQLMREYVDTIGQVYDQEPAKGPNGHMAGTGAKSEKQGERNTKSVSLESGPDFGGTSKNIARGGNEQAADGKAIPKPNNEYSKGEGKFSKEKFQNAPGGSKKTTPVGKNWESEKGAEGQTTDGKVKVATKAVQTQNTGKKI